jgi:hypothetical protein
MEKEVTVKIGYYDMNLEDRFVTFGNGITNNCVSIPIEEFYHMWNSNELINFMEEYHEKRKVVANA